MKQKKHKRFGNFLRLLPIFIAIAIVLWIFISFIRGVMMYGTVAPIELDTEEKVNYITDVFHIKNTDNIGSYTVSFREGFMTVILKDVKDIHDLCFENFADYGIIEKDYKEIINIPFDECDYLLSYASVTQYQGAWLSTKHQGVRFATEINDQHYSIFLYKEDNLLYCEVSKERNYDVYKKLTSMK